MTDSSSGSPGNPASGATSTTEDPPASAGPRVAPQQMRDVERLRRSRTDRKVAGVAGGLGRHFDIDPTVVRVVLVVLVFFGCAGLLLYGALWLLVPEEGRDDAALKLEPSTRRVLLIAAGLVTLLVLLGNSWGHFWFPWPLALVAALVAAVVIDRQHRRDRAADGDRPAPPTPPGVSGEPAPEPASPAPPYPSLPPPGGTGPRSPRRRGPLLALPTLALVAIALGLLGLYDANGGAVADGAYAALALAVIGAMALVATRYGRGLGLGLMGLVALVTMIATSVVGNVRGPHDLSFAPTSASTVVSHYSIGAGRMVLDLRGVSDLGRLDGRSLDVSGGAGDLELLIPDGLDVEVDAHVRGGGQIEIGDRIADGWGPTLHRTLDGGPGRPTLHLDVSLTFGQIQVTQTPALRSAA